MEEVKEILAASGEYTECTDEFGKVGMTCDIRQLPEQLDRYVGREISIAGYIIAGGQSDKDNYRYLLAKNSWDWCCQGVPPTLFTSIIVKTDKPIDVDRFAKINCKGIFKAQTIKNSNGDVAGLFVVEKASIQKVILSFQSVLIVFLVLLIVALVVERIKIFQKKKVFSMSEKNKNILFECKDMAIGYGSKTVLSSLKFMINEGNLWGIIGPNGSGKTTLIRTIMGILKPLSGTSYCKKNIRFGYVMQRQAIDSLYPFSVFDLVKMGRYGAISPPKRLSGKDIQSVEDALFLTGISALRDIPFRELSGGQKQRALIARALCSDPDLIILDEPTNDMDIAGEEAVLSLIKKIHKQKNVGVIVVSHLLPVVLNIADNILFLKGLKSDIAIYRKDDLVYENHLERFYNIPIKITKNKDRYSVVIEGGDTNDV